MGSWHKPGRLNSAPRQNFNSDKLPENELKLLFLIPLVQVAWAHGAISPRERQVIFAAARDEGIDEIDPLNDRLALMLVYQPSRRFFDSCLQLINERLQTMTIKERERRKQKILDYATRVAAAAGEKSLMDVSHNISFEERLALADIMAAMNKKSNQTRLNC
jgi:hypothetical protein